MTLKFSASVSSFQFRLTKSAFQNFEDKNTLFALLIGPVLHHITCVITPLLINNFEQIKKSYRRD